MNDNEIVARSLDNLDYFSCLYLRYEPELLRYIQRISGIDQDDARDILQEAYIKIWRHLNEFDSGMKLSSWIYRIVHNETVSFSRKKRSFGKDITVNIDLYRNIMPEESRSDEEMEDKLSAIVKFLDRIPLKYKEVLVLKYLERKSYEEISDILKIPEGTVAIRINRAKKGLRALAAHL